MIKSANFAVVVAVSMCDVVASPQSSSGDVTAAGKNRKRGILRKTWIGSRKRAKQKCGTFGGLDLANVDACYTKARA
jgi:hypothetical protein